MRSRILHIQFIGGPYDGHVQPFGDLGLIQQLSLPVNENMLPLLKGEKLGPSSQGESLRLISNQPMIFRLSQKLNAKIRAGTLPAQPLDANPFADWSAHLFVVDRTQYILIGNTKSLYSTVMLGKGITDESQFLDHALSGLREFMQQDGQEFVFRRFIAPAGATVQFAKAVDRAVTGSMNELVFHASAMLVEEGLSPFEVGVKLNDVLLSAIAQSKSAKYGVPREAFKALAGGTER